MQEKEILFGGRWRKTSRRIAVVNPYSMQTLAEVCTAGSGELEEAISSASEAAKKMKKLSRFQISQALRLIADGIERRRSEFIRSIAEEAAKPVVYARAEVERAIATFRWASGEAERFVGEIVPVDTQPVGKGKIGWTQRVPRGVIFGITPFNFPLNLVAHKVAPALASGNAIIIKPSSKTPLTALLLGEVFLESGLPESALQVLPMESKLVSAIFDDERIKMISFTGSAEVGWKLKAQAPKKQVTLELGGNAPVIIDETADVDKSVERSVFGAFSYSGQVCISVQQIFVHSSIFDIWTEKFVSQAKALKRGDPLDEETRISSMIDEEAAKKTEKWVGEAVENGAKILCGGTREGNFYAPTVLTNTSPEMKVVSEEVFAPVVVVEQFSEFEESVEMANRTKYGLQVGVFTQDFARMRYAFDNLEYGGVIINDVPTFRVDNMPYGGVKDSGFGREGLRYAMEEMTEIRLIVAG
ncbi:MAG: aldehyde dehydrogenase family protein [Acidobacteria bacterium]|jgi:glyceraldehyde-3-phosphate dehydrogenase (NADP+)|nr:MAG: aldehyde dehydrogenase family protein [Acidobacteriota bacterium]GIU80998.1 MAG: aldehyde dehydrogenase [Pyrinomonadaceae bacterium]